MTNSDTGIPNPSASAHHRAVAAALAGATSWTLTTNRAHTHRKLTPPGSHQLNSTVPVPDGSAIQRPHPTP
ncbi:hypothetical protein GCM10023319_08670 [Nocardia iowensis]